MVLLFALV